MSTQIVERQHEQATKPPNSLTHLSYSPYTHGLCGTPRNGRRVILKGDAAVCAVACVVCADLEKAIGSDR